MNRKGNRKKITTTQRMRCPYCGKPVVYRSADGIYHDNSNQTMLYVCSNYPECDAYVRVHPGTKVPMGSLADRRLRALRKSAHDHFDRLYLSRYMTKQEAYRWLAYIISAPMSEAHIGHLGEYYCRLVIEESRKLLELRRNGLSMIKGAEFPQIPSLQPRKNLLS